MLKANKTSKSKSNLLIIRGISFVRSQAEQLIEVADTAVALHRADILSQVSPALAQMGLEDAGRYYQAVAERGAVWQQTPAVKVLEDIAERGPNLWRAKAAVTLGLCAFETGDFYQATNLYNEARALGSGNSLISLHIQEMKAQIASLDGDHKTALNRLLESLPAAQGIHRLNHLNSLAVELNALGRVDEAKHYLEPCLSSPYKAYYPEWSDTATEVYSPSRSTIYNPGFQPDKISARVATNPMRALMTKILDFNKKKEDGPRLPTISQVTLAAFVKDDATLTHEECDFIRVVIEYVIASHPPFETLKEGADYLERLFKREEQE